MGTYADALDRSPRQHEDYSIDGPREFGCRPSRADRLCCNIFLPGSIALCENPVPALALPSPGSASRFASPRACRAGYGLRLKKVRVWKPAGRKMGAAVREPDSG